MSEARKGNARKILAKENYERQIFWGSVATYSPYLGGMAVLGGVWLATESHPVTGATVAVAGALGSLVVHGGGTLLMLDASREKYKHYDSAETVIETVADSSEVAAPR